VRSLSQALIIYALALLLGVKMNWQPLALAGVLVVVIIGALLLWHPWNANNGSASNTSGTTTGQTSTGTGGSAPGKK